jgi:hypothetical protein
MGSGAPSTGPGGKVRKLEVAGGRATFDADQRTHDRENTPVIIDGRTFLRARKDWATSRAMRSIMREQEKNVALANRLRIRVGELEVEQAEAATEADDDRELELEGKIDELVRKADDATEAAEIVSYRLLALLLIPQAYGEDEEVLPGFGPVEDPEEAAPAIAFLQPALDVEDAANLANELTGSSEPDPPETPSSESGSS